MVHRSFVHRSEAGMTLPEVTVVAAVMSLLMGALLVGTTTLQRSFAAAQEHSQSQLEQARFIDYVARDLRRALAVKTDTYLGGQRISMAIPHFYELDASATPRAETPVRTPTISGGYANYGSDQIVIRYFKNGSRLIRRVNGLDTVIATDVADFQLTFPPQTSQQVVNIAVTFAPRFRISGSQEAQRSGTMASASILLRNKRNNATVPDTP